MKKRLLAALLALVMVCALLPTAALAADNDFVIDEDGVLTKYNGPGGDVVIPDGVTGIGDSAFEDCKSLTSVIIPEGVTSIGRSAFWGCTGLTSVTIPEGVTSIGERVFCGCRGLTSVTIPEGVISIGRWAFSLCVGLKTAGPIGGGYDIEFGWTTRIPDNAFYICSGLTNVTIPDSVTSIGQYAFYSCSSLTSITIPGSVTSIGEFAFWYCTGLKTAGPIGGGYDYEFGWTTKISDNAFEGCVNLTSITIPESVTTIGEYAFFLCTGLTSVTIPGGVTSIERQAFRYCSGLTSMTIPEGVTSIGQGAFSLCVGLKTAGPIGGGYDIEFGWTTKIPDNALSGCTDLTSVTIPESVTTIGESAFDGCSSLTSVTIPEGVTNIGDRTFESCTSLTSITIPDSVTSIEGYAFRHCTSLTSVTIPDSVTSIGQQAFDGCTGLKTAGPIGGGYNIEFGWTTKIPDTAFSNCTSLTSVTIPDSVTSIGWSAFSICTSLTSVTIPDSVTDFGYGVFANCTGLKTAGPIGGGYDIEFGWTTKILNNAFSNCTGLTSITIPESVTSIEGHAFRYCTSLTSVIIPESVISIGQQAFDGCTSLTSVTIPDSVTSIGDRTFRDCPNLTVYGQAGSEAERYCDENSIPFVAVWFSPGTALTGSLESDTGKSIPWSITAQGKVTIDVAAADLAPQEAVLVGCYDSNGRFTGVKVLDASNTSAQIDPSTPNVKLFWLGAKQNPLSPSVTVWGK